ncbi:ATP-binding protein [Candidatus Woesearchaeota archaeon]|nr:ATP-binding protein [Candidatus Woesearchaeota archaeon]
MAKKEIFKLIIKEFHEKDIPKTVERKLRIPETNKIVSIIGSRRAGKTFYFYHIMKTLHVSKDKILYLNFEDDRILPLELKDMDSVLEAYYELYPDNKKSRIYLFFDEIQNIDKWEIYIRRIYDNENVKIFVTGSSSKLLSKEIATSLRGRTLAFEIYPLSFKEFLEFNNQKIDKEVFYSKQRFVLSEMFEKYLNFGGFPEIAIEKNNLQYQILANYFEVMIYKDIIERFSVRNIKFLKELSKYILTNIGKKFSINAYYNTVKQNASTSKSALLKYLSYLEEANMIMLIPFFSYSLKVQNVNPKKVYCIDTGLRNAVSFKFSKDEGKLAENIVFLELKRRDKEIFYWEDKNEVDFIIKDKSEKITAINVTYTNEIDEREINSLLDFRKKYEKCTELIIITKDVEKEENGIKYIPIIKWLLLN